MKTLKPRVEPLVDVCDLLWQQVDKPLNLEMCRAINVYDNRYRINVYTRKYDQEFDIERVRITQSYFAQLEGTELTIKYQ
jgi:hypothetical protein